MFRPAIVAAAVFMQLASPWAESRSAAAESTKASSVQTLSSGQSNQTQTQDCHNAYLNSIDTLNSNCTLLKNALVTDPRIPIRVGASDLMETLLSMGGRQKVRLAQVLDGCQNELTPKSSAPPLFPAFDCTVMVTNIAALAYRDKAFGAEFVSDGGSTLTVAGLIAALIEYQQNASAVRWTSIVGVIPIVSEEALQMRSRERLYLISATALTEMTNQYFLLHSYINQVGGARALAHADSGAIAKACAGIDDLSAEVAKWTVASERLTVAPELTDLQTRCAAISAADAILSSDYSTLNNLNSDAILAASLATDAKKFDDQVALLDRDLRATPTQAFRETLGAPFNLVGKILAGTSQPSALSDVATTLFAKPFTLPLKAAPVLATPTLPAGALVMKSEVSGLVSSANTAVQTAATKSLKTGKAAKSTAKSSTSDDLSVAQNDRDQITKFQTSANSYLTQLNTWLVVLTNANAAISQIQSYTAETVLTVDYTANNQPVTFTKASAATPPASQAAKPASQ